jgi:hypothetical protein
MGSQGQVAAAVDAQAFFLDTPASTGEHSRELGLIEACQLLEPAVECTCHGDVLP